MKITTNFVASPTRLVRPMATVFWGLTCLVALAALWLAQATINTRSELPELREHLLQLKQRQRQLVNQERSPPDAELRDIQRRVAALNTLSGSHGHSVTTLLADLETWLPSQAWLVSVHDRARNGEVLIVSECESVEPLTAFLLRLEQQSRFSEVLLVKQTPRGAPRKSVQFEIRLKERS
jgi:Fimbrial assembly protein (PilN)